MGNFLKIYSNGLCLNEAFQAKDMEKAIKLIKKYLERKTAYTFYDSGDVEEFKNKFGNQIGIRYFLGNTTRSVRFNWMVGQKSAEISSIDIWDDGKSPYAAVHVEVSDISIVKVLPQIAQLIRKPAVSNLAVEGYEIAPPNMLSEKKVTVNGVTYISVKDAAVSLYQDGYDLESISDMIHVKLSAIKYYINNAVEVTRGAKDEKRKPSKSERDADKLQASYAKFQDPEVELPALRQLLSNVITGLNPSLIIAGSAGIGKTYTTQEMLSKAGLKENEGYKLVKGTATAKGLYTTMFINKDAIIVFDDTDSIWTDKTAVNMLKAALDSNERRIVSWNSAQTYDPYVMDILSYEEQRAYYADTGKLPAQFDFEGGIIFITNLAVSELDNAVKNRSAIIDLTFSPEDVSKVVKKIIPGFDISLRSGKVMISKKDQLAVYEVFNDYIKGNPGYASIRTFVNFLKAWYSGAPNWKELATKYYN